MLVHVSAFGARLFFAVEADAVAFGITEEGDVTEANVGWGHKNLAASGFDTRENIGHLMVDVEVDHTTAIGRFVIRAKDHRPVYGIFATIREDGTLNTHDQLVMKLDIKDGVVEGNGSIKVSGWDFEKVDGVLHDALLLLTDMFRIKQRCDNSMATGF